MRLLAVLLVVANAIYFFIARDEATGNDATQLGPSSEMLTDTSIVLMSEMSLTDIEPRVEDNGVTTRTVEVNPEPAVDELFTPVLNEEGASELQAELPVVAGDVLLEGVGVPVVPETSALALEPEGVSNGGCWVFESAEEGQIDALALELTSQSIPFARGSREDEREGPYVVYVRPFDSYAAALEEFRVLRGLGVDSFVITEGERENGISVGVFGSEANAQVRVAEIQALGYDVDFARFVITDTVFTLAVKQLSGDFDPREWAENLSDRFVVQHTEQISCETVA